MTAWYGPAYDGTSNRGVLTVEAYFKAALTLKSKASTGAARVR